MFIAVSLFLFARWRVFHACTAETVRLADWQRNTDHNSSRQSGKPILRRGMMEPKPADNQHHAAQA
jgi:hypothetical protein